jgi:class 3 adenylate cyclase
MSNEFVKRGAGGIEIAGVPRPSYLTTLDQNGTLFGSGGSSGAPSSIGFQPMLGTVDRRQAEQLEAQRRRHAEDVAKLKSVVAAMQRDIDSVRGDASAKDAQLKAVTEQRDELERLTKVDFLLDSVSDAAQAMLIRSPRLKSEFLSDAAKPLYVLAIDIRRSTELMLKAESPKAFADFITNLCGDLIGIVKSHHGVVDKFTGDGILCFFPEFFSGRDAGYLAIAAASECHDAFERHYSSAWSSFNSVLADVGLGIGVDYGACQLVQVAGALTIVGVPVVYACRLAGAPAGTTLVNQPAFKRLSSGPSSGFLTLTPTRIDVKHERALIAHTARIGRPGFVAAAPAWMDFEDSVDSPNPEDVP